MQTKTLVTAQELATLKNDGTRYELIAGELIRMPPAKPKHSWVGFNFGYYLRLFIEPNELGIVLESSAGYLFERAPDTVLAPDVSFIHRDHLPLDVDWDEYFRVIPDAVMEVLSPSERKAQIDRKVRLYLDHGVRLVILADPRKKHLILHTPDRQSRILAESDLFDGEDVIPGFRLPVAQIFALPKWLRPTTPDTNGVTGD